MLRGTIYAETWDIVRDQPVGRRWVRTYDVRTAAEFEAEAQREFEFKREGVIVSFGPIAPPWSLASSPLPESR